MGGGPASRRSRGPTEPRPAWLRFGRPARGRLPWVALVALLVCVPGGITVGFGHAASSAAGSNAGSPRGSGSQVAVAAVGGCPTASPAGCGSDLSPGPSYSNVNWANLSSTLGTTPDPRAFAASAFDAKRQGVVLFGGQGADGAALGDTWEFSQGRWDRLTVDVLAPAARWGATAVYDSIDGYTLLFGGTNGSVLFSDSWVFNRSGWHLLAPAVAPPARADATASYDPALGAVVLFGGEGALRSVLNDTWTFRGGTWTNASVTFTSAPPARTLAASGYDPTDGYLVLFGGSSGVGSADVRNDVWRLDPTGWRNLTASDPTASGPSARAGAEFADDPSLGNLVLFGGTAAPGVDADGPTDAWVFAQGAWTSTVGSLGPAPGPREGASFNGDPFAGCSLLFGGATAAVPRGDTWSLGGTVLQISVTVSPTAGAAPLNASFSLTVSGGIGPYSVNWSFGDRLDGSGEANVSHVYGLPGNYTATATVIDSAGDAASRSTPIAVLTSWQGGHQWASVGSSERPAPSPRSSAQAAYDPSLKAVILFGGETQGGTALSDTWEFVNNVWIDLTSAMSPHPSARWGGGFTYDTVDSQLVLFGGTDGQGFLGDTWTFNGSGWAERSTTGPSARAFGQMAFDTYDGYVVLFGGAQQSPTGSGWIVDSDTWEYRAGSWANITSQLPIAPPPTAGGASAYDPADGALLLFGGSSVAPGGAPGTCYPNGATWSFSGGSWTSVAGSTVPAGQMQPMEAFDATDHLVLVFGGAQSVGGICRVTAATWSYVGGGWSNLSGPAAASPAGRDGGAITFDAAEGVVLLFGGDAMGLKLNDTWVYPAPLNTSATSQTGNATSGSSGGSGGSNGNGTPTNGTPPGGNGGGGGGTPSLPFNVGYTVSQTGSSGPMTVAFVATAVGGRGPFTFEWYFGDSSSVAVAPQVSHRYTVPGSYNPVLTATDATGETIVRVLATIQVAPALTATAPTGSDTSFAGPSGSEISELFLGAGAVVVIALVVVFRRQERRTEEVERVPDIE